MSDVDPSILQSSIDRLAKLSVEFRALRPGPEKVQAVRAAAARVQAALARERGTDQPVLTIAFAGCTGAGKSTLINSLARSRITRVIGRAATTRQAHVYHHQQVRLAGLPRELAQSAVMVPHDRPELQAKVLIDTPDLDTAIITNRQTTKTILKAATLVLYVFTPEKYAEERVWSVIEQERRFSAFAAVLNKIDRLAPDELERVTEDLRGLFAANGAADVRVFRTVAVKHQPDENGKEPPAYPDDFEALRSFVEKELRRADILRLARRQRRAAVASLQSAVDGVVPAGTVAKLDSAAAAGEAALADASKKVADYWRPVFLAAEDAVLPAAKRRYHERFRGPMRAWFAMWDGVAAVAHRFAGKPDDTLDLSSIKSALEAGRQQVDDRLSSVSQRVQDALHVGGLPISRWTAAIAGRSPAQQVVNDAAGAVESVCREQAIACSPAQEKLATIISWITVAFTAVVVLVGTFNLFWNILKFGLPSDGVMLLFELVGLLALGLLGLHLFVGLAGPGGQKAAAEEAGRKAVEEAMSRVLKGWLSAYREDLDADVAEVRGPMEAATAALAAEDAELGESPSDVAEEPADQGTGLGMVAPATLPFNATILAPAAAPIAEDRSPLAEPASTAGRSTMEPKTLVFVVPAESERTTSDRSTEGLGNHADTNVNSTETEASALVYVTPEPTPIVSEETLAPTPSTPKKSLSDYLKEMKR